MAFIEVEHEQFNPLIFLMQFLLNRDYLIAKLFVLFLQLTTGMLFLFQLQGQLLYEFLCFVV